MKEIKCFQSALGVLGWDSPIVYKKLKNVILIWTISLKKLKFSPSYHMFQVRWGGYSQNLLRLSYMYSYVCITLSIKK